MGALPSRESQQQGLLGFIQGRKNKTEVFLVPLTRDFFPSPDCPLFMSLFHARQRRTAKYYFRSPRPTTASKDSDYYCQTTAVDAPEAFDAYCQRRQADAQAGHPDPVTATSPLPSDAPMKEHDYRYEAYADTPEGLYHVLVTESELAMVDTDAELRERYFQELQQANAVLGRPLRPQGGSPWPCTPSMEDAAAAERMAQGYSTSGFLSAVRYYRGRAGHTLTREDQCHATAHPCRCPPCMRLRRRHRRRHQQSMRRGVRASFDGATSAHALFPTSRPSLRGTPLQRLWLQRVIAPTAHNIRPIPCAVVSRCDEKKAEEDVVDFDGMPVKVVGMFGLLPTTHRARAGVVTGECDVDGRRSHCPAASMTDGAVDECRLYDDDDDDDGDCCGEWEGMSDDMEEADEGSTGVTVNHHLLKAGMFVEKEEGDQLIGQVVLLAANMYLRQCIQARIKPRFLPMLPFMLRFPLTNQPMLQLVREFRVRLRSLLDAGTAVSGERPVFSGINGFAGDAAQKPHNPARQRQQEEGYLYEDDIPYVSCAADLLDAGEVSRTPSGSSLSNHSFQPSPTTPMYCSGLSNTNTRGTIPIYLNSGVSAHRGSLRHPGLYDTGSTCSSPTMLGAPSTTSSASATARLLRRKSRFRMWVEDGHLCLWASAAYTRRACLLLAQQVGTKVTCDAMPEPRQWNYVGLLHGGGVVPAPQRADDVLVVATDIPEAGLWQGDVLRCSTAAEVVSCANGLCDGSAASTPRSAPAPPGAFWVRGSGGLDDSRTNTSEATPLEKAEWKKTPPLAATGDVACAAPAVPAAKVPPVDRRLGTLNLEEVLLSWVKRIAGLKREVDEMDDEWVRDPDGQCVHVDRYVISRLEHDGVRYYFGVVPRVLSECPRDAGSLSEGIVVSGEATTDGGLTSVDLSFCTPYDSDDDDVEGHRYKNLLHLSSQSNGTEYHPQLLEQIKFIDFQLD